MNRAKRFFPLAMSLLFFISAPAYSADEFLSSALKIAETRSKKLAVAHEQIGLSNTRVFNSGRQFFPSLGLERKETKGKTINAEYQAQETGIKGSLSLYQGGKLRASYRYDSLMLTAAKFNFTKTREELYSAVKLAYYEFLSFRMQLKALSDAYDGIERLHSKVIAEYDAKAISELDLIESENFRDKVRDMVENTKDDIALAERKLLVLLNVEKLDEIPIPLPEGLPEDTPEVSFSLSDCIDFSKLNNLDVVSAQLQVKVAEQKQKIVRSRVIPNLGLEGSYGQAGEAFITQPLDLATTWTVMGKINWGLWGNSLEVSHDNEKTAPEQITDPTARIEANVTDIKFSLLDDLNYFIQSKETVVGFNQARSDHNDSTNKATIDVTKSYNDYRSSLRDARTYRNEIVLKKRKLAYMKKRNDLYEIPTVQLMEESWKYAETIASYAKAINKNYSAVTELERLTLVSMR